MLTYWLNCAVIWGIFTLCAIVLEGFEMDRGPRHFCRNPRCRSLMKEPIDNPHRAFCTVGCYEQYFRHRCAVCEREMERTTERRRICERRNCRNLLRQWPIRYAPMVRGASGGFSPDRNADGLGIQTRRLEWSSKSPVWRVITGPPIHPINLVVLVDPARRARMRPRRANGETLIGPRDWPIEFREALKRGIL